MRLRMKVCKICGEEKQLEDFYTNGKTPKGSVKYKPECKLCHTELQQEFVELKQRKLDEVFGTSCVVCGYSRCRKALDFHHTNPNIKEYEPSQITRNYMTVENMLKELESCVLLCSNCHREVHAGFITL